MFFDGSVRSTRRTSCSGRRADERRLPLEHRRILAQPVELRRVDADRMRDDARRAAAVLDRPGLPVDARAEQPLRREQERAPPAVGVEADDVVREQPLVHGDPQLRRQRVPVVRLRPRDVDEVRRHDAGPRLPDERRREVEVVVVEEHRRVGLALELLERRRGERLVDRHVARRSRPRAAPARSRERSPGPRGSAAGTRESGSRGRCRSGRMQPGSCATRRSRYGGAVRRLLDERAVLLRRHGPVLVGHRARHPGHVVVGEQAAERRDDTAAAPLRHATPVGVTRVRDRRAVEDDEELPPRRCRC